jgi:hypothetical protein
MRLWRKASDEGKLPGGGKFLVLRRDGTVPDWPAFVLGARDPAAPAALHAYATRAAELGKDPAFVADIHVLADEFELYRSTHGEGDPDAPPHRKDLPIIIEMMKLGKGA